MVGQIVPARAPRRDSEVEQQARLHLHVEDAPAVDLDPTEPGLHVRDGVRDAVEEAARGTEEAGRRDRHARREARARGRRAPLERFDERRRGHGRVWAERAREARAFPDTRVDRSPRGLLERRDRRVRGRSLVEEARTVETDRVRGDHERADRYVLARAAGGADADHGERPCRVRTGSRAALARREVESSRLPTPRRARSPRCRADAGAERRDRQPPVRARERHELAVLHLVVHAIEARGDAVGPRRVAHHEEVRRELVREQAEVVDASVHDDDLGGAGSGHSERRYVRVRGAVKDRSRAWIADTAESC